MEKNNKTIKALICGRNLDLLTFDRFPPLGLNCSLRLAILDAYLKWGNNCILRLAYLVPLASWSTALSTIQKWSIICLHNYDGNFIFEIINIFNINSNLIFTLVGESAIPFFFKFNIRYYFTTSIFRIQYRRLWVNMVRIYWDIILFSIDAMFQSSD